MPYNNRRNQSSNAQVLDQYSVEGVLYRIFPPTKRGNYSVTNFIVKKDDGTEAKVSSFSSVDPALLGSRVSFPATYNSQYNQYTLVKGADIISAEGVSTSTPSDVRKEVATEASIADVPARRRGRPARTEAPSTSAVPVVDSAREALRAQAEESTFRDLESAKRLVERLGLDVTDVAGLVSLADRVGRTITAIGLDNGRR